MPGKSIGYIRVSTVDQNTERQLTDVQLDKVFEDKVSGSTIDRPQLKACLDYLRDGDDLWVHSIDRLARNLQDLLNIIALLREKGVTLHFKKEGMVFHPESNDPFQRFQLEILGAVASFERNLIRERQREGIALAKKRNAYAKCGRPAALTEEQMDELRKRLKKGEKVAELAKEYGISRQTIYKLIRSNSLKK